MRRESSYRGPTKDEQDAHLELVAKIERRALALASDGGIYKPKVALGHYVDCLTWERTLAELSGGEYDGVLGLRVFVHDLLARIAELEAEVEKGRATQ